MREAEGGRHTLTGGNCYCYSSRSLYEANYAESESGNAGVLGVYMDVGGEDKHDGGRVPLVTCHKARVGNNHLGFCFL